MWEHFIKAMEYRSYCMAATELRRLGYLKELESLLKHKKTLYDHTA